MPTMPSLNRSRTKHLAAALLVMASALQPLSLVQAATLQVSPVRLQFEPKQHAQALQVSNSGNQPLDAQVRILRWTQENGEDRLTPADDIVVSPAILRVPPGQQQTVRLIRVKPVDGPQELSYRVLVDELPNKDASAPRTGLKVLLRYSIPVFVAPTPTEPALKRARVAGPAQADLSGIHAQVLPGAGGKTELRVRNDGASHLRISNLSASGPGQSKKSLGDGLIGYVLPGQQMSWPVDLPHPLSPDLTIKARFNDDRQARALPLDRTSR